MAENHSVKRKRRASASYFSYSLNHLPADREVERFLTMIKRSFFDYCSVDRSCLKPNKKLKTTLFRIIFKCKLFDLKYRGLKPCEYRAERFSARATVSFFNRLNLTFDLLKKDALAFYNGDPSAKSVFEIVYSYTSFFAVFAYRIANLLNCLNVPFLPRKIAELSKSKSGVDIHPAALIGAGFCIDHGVGTFIGETTVIGKNVRLYHGVTLGAKNLNRARNHKNKKRHPTIGDNVIIYSGAVVLGGKTTVKSNSVVPCGALIKD